jgi:hypothetical protein
MILVGQEKLLSKPVDSTRRERRAIKLFAVVLVAVCVAAVIVAVNRGGSRAGCVSVSTPSYTGAVVASQCGAQAKASCRAAYATKAGGDVLAGALRAACPKAGYPAPAG